MSRQVLTVLSFMIWLTLYDLANPAAPSFITEYDFVTSGYIRDVKVVGNYAYCANAASYSTNSLGIDGLSRE